VTSFNVEKEFFYRKFEGDGNDILQHSDPKSKGADGKRSYRLANISFRFIDRVSLEKRQCG